MKSPLPAALTIGNFDGVHRGHRALVEAVTHWRRSHSDPSSLRTVVVSFDPHPADVLRPDRPVARLTSTNEKIHLLQNLGVDEVRILPFTPDFARMPAKDFFDQVLLKELDARFVAVGHNFYFGHNREGTPGKMIDWCGQRGIEARLIEAVESDGGPISSSRIRKLIEEGQLIAASRLLGRDYSISGEVVHGDKRGRILNVPTANILPRTEGTGKPCLPARGVYLSTATVEGKTFPSITNVGVKPTVSHSGQVSIETHLLDYPHPNPGGPLIEDLYGKYLTVEFKDRLRDEKRFSGIEELTKQIQEDIRIARSRIV